MLERHPDQSVRDEQDAEAKEYISKALNYARRTGNTLIFDIISRELKTCEYWAIMLNCEAVFNPDVKGEQTLGDAFKNGIQYPEGKAKLPWI